MGLESDLDDVTAQDKTSAGGGMLTPDLARQTGSDNIAKVMLECLDKDGDESVDKAEFSAAIAAAIAELAKEEVLEGDDADSDLEDLEVSLEDLQRKLVDSVD